MDKDIRTLTEAERSLLRHMASSGKAAARKLTHARMLLVADASAEGPAKTDDDLQQALGVGLSTIHRVRQPLVMESFAAAWSPRPSPARPPKVKSHHDGEQALSALACSDPPQGRHRWTLHLWADPLVLVGKLPSVSLEAGRQALQTTRASLG
jgi:hypothetical protein